jgi:cytochrome c556
MMRTVVAVAAVAVGVTAVVAQSDPLSQRKGLMKGNIEGAKNVISMVRGEAAFDALKINAAFSQWADTAQKLPGLFPEPPKPGEESRAMPRIWEARSDFDAKIAAFAKAIDDNKDKAKTLDELKVAVSNVSKACDNCHELYRRPQQR